MPFFGSSTGKDHPKSARKDEEEVETTILKEFEQLIADEEKAVEATTAAALAAIEQSTTADEPAIEADEDSVRKVLNCVHYMDYTMRCLCRYSFKLMEKIGNSNF
jgi:hypothetical protein